MWFNNKSCERLWIEAERSKDHGEKSPPNGPQWTLSIVREISVAFSGRKMRVKDRTLQNNQFVRSCVANEFCECGESSWIESGVNSPRPHLLLLFLFDCFCDAGGWDWSSLNDKRRATAVPVVRSEKQSMVIFDNGATRPSHPGSTASGGRQSPVVTSCGNLLSVFLTTLTT